MARSQTAQSISEEQAYRAMLKFLERHWQRTGSEDFGAFLGSADLRADGVPADAALRQEWQKCIREILAADAAKHAAE